MSIEGHTDVRGYFREQLIEALQRRNVRTGETTEFYLVNLLTGFAMSAPDAVLERPLVSLLAEATEATGGDRLRRFRDLGDAALYITGFFSDHLERRGVSRSYAATLGGRAYRAAFDLAQTSVASDFPLAEVFGELAERFDAYANVFDDVRESTTFRTPQEIVKLYEKWKTTRSPLIASRLEREGVFPVLALSAKVTIH